MIAIRRVLMAGVMLTAAPVLLAGQDTPDSQPALDAARQRREAAAAQELRRNLEERFGRRVRLELGLTDEESLKLREVAGRWFVTRRALEREGRALRAALATQLRPGVAANADSVTHITKRLLDLKVELAESYRQENAELSFLTPVQRAQYYALRERLLELVREAQHERRHPRGAR